MSVAVLRRALALPALGLLVSTASAQESAPVTATFTGAPGLSVEILGLERWTPQMLRDSLAVHAPGHSFASREIAAVLQEELGFPEAIAARHQNGDSAVNVLLAVIEPQDSARVRMRALGIDTTRSVAPWERLVTLARTQFELLAAATTADVYARVVNLPPHLPLAFRPDSAMVRQAWAALAAHRATADAAEARRVLVTSPNPYDRLAAIAVLAAFDGDDRTWHALVGALRDPDERVRGFASLLLRTFTAQVSRPIDWRPAVTDLHALLNGTALGALPSVLDLLVATDIDPALAGPILENGGHAVLLYAGATSPAIRIPMYRFLRTISKEDRGGIPAHWRAWIAGL